MIELEKEEKAGHGHSYAGGMGDTDGMM